MGGSATSAGVADLSGVKVARGVGVGCDAIVPPDGLLKNPGTIMRKAANAATPAKIHNNVSKMGKREKS